MPLFSPIPHEIDTRGLEGGWAEQNVCDKNETACVEEQLSRGSCWDGCSCLGSFMMIKAERLWGKIRQLGEYTQTRTKVNKRHKHADKHQRLHMKMDDRGDSRVSEAGAMKFEKAFIYKINYHFFVVSVGSVFIISKVPSVQTTLFIGKYSLHTTFWSENK